MHGRRGRERRGRVQRGERRRLDEDEDDGKEERGMRGRSRFNDCIGGRLMVWCCEIGDQLNVFKHHKASQHSRYVCAPPPLSLFLLFLLLSFSLLSLPDPLLTYD